MSEQYDEYTPEQIGRVIRTVFGQLNGRVLEQLLHAEQEAEYAGMQLGLNAQVAASYKVDEAVENAINSLSKFGIKEFSKHIDCAIHNKEYKL